jgi:peptide/nickel transport system ATP-binding protein
MIPDPLNRPSGCSFNNRCDDAIPGTCDTRTPTEVGFGGGHFARCLRHTAEFKDAPATLPSMSVSASAPVRPPASERTRSSETLLRIEGLRMHFPIRRGWLRRETGAVRAVNDLSLSVGRGEMLGVVGESGCGKTTTGRCVIRTLTPTAGSILFRQDDGSETDVARLGRGALKAYHRQVRMIFQDPFSSLDPRKPVLDIIGEPLIVHGVARGREVGERVAALMRQVGLRPDYMRRYPHAFSGGERQRIGIARALALDPRLIICDEAVSALDVSVQAQILNLLAELQVARGLTFLFIAHNLGVVRQVCDRVAVMYLGRIVELSPTQALFEQPLHPYSEALLSAMPATDFAKRRTRKRIVLKGEVPDPASPPTGCPFHTRCPYSDGSSCANEVPALRELRPGRSVACHHADRLFLAGADARH